MENKLLRENDFKIIGTLVNVEIKNGMRKDNGQEYVSADATVQSVINGIKNEFEIGFYANKLTKDGKESQLFVTYSKLGELQGKKIEINGDIRENRYWSTSLGQIVSSQQLSGRFVRGVSDSVSDVATYSLGGFIAKTLVEKTNKDGEVYRYDLAIGQANYNGNGMSMYTLHVNPNQREIVSGVEGYNVGDTVVINGSLVFKTEQVTVTDANNAFGTGLVKTYTNKQKNFFIEGGSNPLDDERAYSSDVIKTLIDAYKANDIKLAGAAKDSSKSAPVTKEAPITRRQTSLL